MFGTIFSYIYHKGKLNAGKYAWSIGAGARYFIQQITGAIFPSNLWPSVRKVCDKVQDGLKKNGKKILRILGSNEKLVAR